MTIYHQLLELAAGADRLQDDDNLASILDVEALNTRFGKLLASHMHLIAIVKAMQPARAAPPTAAPSQPTKASLTPASLETAACLWEAVLDMETDASEPSTPEQQRAQAIREARAAIGTSGLRLIVIGWTEACDAAWHAIDDPTGGCPGQYGEAFDWDFVPGWIIDNVDWSDPHNPTLRK